MYDIGHLRKALHNPWLVYSELCRPLVRLNTVLNRQLLRRRGVHVMDKDWDNLIILDGCRYDTFARQNIIDGDLSAVVSGGSSSPDFMRYNFAGRTYLDTVYVSANPYLVRENLTDNFFRDYKLWQTDWDPETRTVLPDVVVDRTLGAYSDYPDKRLIAHFMQPHFPFIGETGRRIKHAGLTDNTDATRIWDQLKHREVDHNTVVRAYEENLDIVLPHVERLIAKLDGKSVITADHGNLFGRFGVYGHPHQVFLSDLVKVPWLEVEGDRREIKAGEPDETHCQAKEDIDTRIVNERLADLGYLEE